MSCGNVACGRYIAEHAVQHYNDTKHPLAIEVNDTYVFWYYVHYMSFMFAVGSYMAVVHFTVFSMLVVVFFIYSSRKLQILISVNKF